MHVNFVPNLLTPNLHWMIALPHSHARKFSGKPVQKSGDYYDSNLGIKFYTHIKGKASTHFELYIMLLINSFVPASSIHLSEDTVPPFCSSIFTSDCTASLKIYTVFFTVYLLLLGNLFGNLFSSVYRWHTALSSWSIINSHCNITGHAFNLFCLKATNILSNNLSRHVIVFYSILTSDLINFANQLFHTIKCLNHHMEYHPSSQ